MQARGLFVEQVAEPPHGQMRWVVRGRSYHKFFYQDERGVAFMAREHLPQMLHFPLTCFIKENGFLGIVFARPAAAGGAPELVVASKSTTEGPFAERVRSMVHEHLARHGHTPAALAARLLRDNVSLVFEAIDPVFDPHIIKYARAHLVLLDVISNQLAAFVRLPYAELRAFAAEYRFQCKRPYATLATLAEYDAFHHRCLHDEVGPAHPSARARVAL